MSDAVLLGVAVPTLVAAGVTVGLLFAPGLALAALLGLRGWLLAGTAPAVTMGLVAIGAPLASGLGMRWQPLTFLGWCVVVIGVTATVVQLFRRRGYVSTAPPVPWSGSGSLFVVAAIVVAAVVAVVVLRSATHGLGTVPQGWDAPFHGNAIRLIADSGNSSPRALGWIDLPDNVGASFYPNAYHCFEALVYSISGSDIPRVMNTGMTATTTLAVPLGTVALVRAAGGAAGFAAASALVSTSFANYPWDLYQWGQLFPYAAGLAMIMPFFALFLRWLDSGADRLAVLVAIVGAGLAGTHTATVFVAAILGLILVGQRLVLDPRRVLRREVPRLAAVSLGIGLLGIAFLVGGASMAGNAAVFDWPAVTTASRALGDGILLSSDTTWPQWLLALITLFGLHRMLRVPEWRWVVACYLTFLALYVLAAASDHPIATAITSPWWNDRYRLVAVVVLPATLAAGWALQTTARDVADWVMTKVPSSTGSRRTTMAVLGTVSAVLAAVFFVQSNGYTVRNAQRMLWTFHGTVVSSGEEAGLAEVGRIVRPGELVMNDRGDGLVWSYALTGVRPVIGHYPSGKTTSAQRELLLERFNKLGSDPEVARVIRDLNVRYVMIGEGLIDKQFKRANGLVDLDRIPELTPVYRNKDFQLYRIDWSRLA